MHVHHLTSVNGEIVFDLDPDIAGGSAGGTRMAEDVTIDELALLARAMTYKFASFEARIGGAKAGIRPRLLDTRAETIDRYCDEIRPLVQSGRFRTGADLGTTAADFAPLDPPGHHSVFDEVVDGVPFEQVVTGAGVVAAAEAWLGSLEGRSVAIEGFGTVGGGVARAVEARGGRVVAVSTIRGAVADGRGLDLARLFAARDEHGETFVHHLGLDVHRSIELHAIAVDVLVPGARPGVHDAATASRVQASVVVPAANVPYTARGLEVLRAAGVVALPDFVCNAGAVLAHLAPRGITVGETLVRAEREIAERITAARLAKADPYTYAVTLAETFLTTWVPAGHRPDGPPLAPEPVPGR